MLQRAVDSLDSWGRRHPVLDALALLVSVAAVVTIVGYWMALPAKIGVFVAGYVAVLGLVARRRRREDRRGDYRS